MASAEDRQAKALEGIERHTRELVRVMGALNENLVVAFKYIKQEIEKDQGDFEAGIDSKNQMSIDDLRAASEKAEKERAERAEYENRTGEMWMEEEKVLTPDEWMNELRRWWNYESIGNMDTIKMTREEFSSYMQRARGTEVTRQVPDKYKHEGSE